MGERLRTTAVYCDGKYIWTVDDTVGGLYKIDMSTMDIFCVIDPVELYRYDSFETASIIEKDSFIIIVPKFLKHRWIFYDKKNQRILYRKILDINSYTPEVRVIGNTVYIPPVFSDGVFVLLDINQMQPRSIIENVCMNNQDFQIWRIFQVGNTCCLPLRGTKLICVTSNDYQKWINMKIEELMGDADGDKGEYWVLPLKGDWIYHMDDRGNIVEKIRLIIDTEELHADDFIRIISTEQYVFLLPYPGRNICIYEKVNHRFFKVCSTNSKITSRIPYDVDDVPYWGYLMHKKEICFLPRFFKWMNIKFDTLDIENKDVFLPHREDYEIINKWARIFRIDNVFLEKDKESLLLYLEYNRMEGTFQNQEVGRSIYENIKEYLR